MPTPTKTEEEYKQDADKLRALIVGIDHICRDGSIPTNHRVALVLDAIREHGKPVSGSDPEMNEVAIASAIMEAQSKRSL